MKYSKGISQKILNAIIARNLPTNHAAAQCFVTDDTESPIKEVIRFYHTKSKKRYSRVVFLPHTFLITKKSHDNEISEGDDDWELFYYEDCSLLGAAKIISEILCDFRRKSVKSSNQLTNNQ